MKNEVISKMDKPISPILASSTGNYLLMKKCFLFLVSIFVLYTVTAQQAVSDMAMINTQVARLKAKPVFDGKRHMKIQKTYNPVKLILYIPLFIYQALVSEQVSANCEFEPSCSNFGVLAIKRLGIVKGLFLTADRLTRCNGEAQPETKYYLINHHTGKVVDVPDFYKVHDGK